MVSLGYSDQMCRQDLAAAGEDVPFLLRPCSRATACDPDWCRSAGATRATDRRVVRDQRDGSMPSSTPADQYRLYFTADGVAVEALSIFRRPPPLNVVEGGQVVVVIGPSGAGNRVASPRCRT